MTTMETRPRSLTGGLIIILMAQGLFERAEGQEWRLRSPDEQVAVTVARHETSGGKTRLSCRVDLVIDGSPLSVLPPSPLGIARADQRFVEDLSLVSEGPVRVIDETYTLPHGKRRRLRNRAHEKVLGYTNREGTRVELVVRAYDDAVAFRYRFPDQSAGDYVVTEEVTGFRLPAGGQAWMQSILPRPHHVNYERPYTRHTQVGQKAGSCALPVLYRAHRGAAWPA